MTVTRAGSVKVSSGFHITFFQAIDDAAFGIQDPSAGCSAPGPATCSFRASFKPTATGATTGALWFVACPTGTDLGNPGCIELQVPVSGTGVAPGSTASTTLAFSSTKAGSQVVKPFTVKHDPGWYVRTAEFQHQPATPDAIFALTGTVFGPVVAPCGQSATATSCVLQPYFHPRTIETVTDTLVVQLCSISDPNVCTNLPAVKTSGTGIAPAKLTGSSVSFGSRAVFTNAMKSVTITFDPGWHFGGSGITATPGSTGGQPPFRGSPYGTGCQSSGTNACQFQVEFSPVAAGKFSGQLAADACNDAGFCVELPRIPVTGTGVLTSTKTSLKSSRTTVPLGQTMVLTATVTPTPYPAASPGTVTFYDGKAVLCANVPVQAGYNDPAGIASCTATAAGSKSLHSLTAVYSGNVGLKTSTSAAVTATYTAP